VFVNRATRNRATRTSPFQSPLLFLLLLLLLSLLLLLLPFLERDAIVRCKISRIDTYRY